MTENPAPYRPEFHFEFCQGRITQLPPELVLIEHKAKLQDYELSAMVRVKLAHPPPKYLPEDVYSMRCTLVHRAPLWHGNRGMETYTFEKGGFDAYKSAVSWLHERSLRICTLIEEHQTDRPSRKSERLPERITMSMVQALHDKNGSAMRNLRERHEKLKAIRKGLTCFGYNGAKVGSV